MISVVIPTLNEEAFIGDWKRSKIIKWSSAYFKMG